MGRIGQEIAARKLTRMRLGQATCVRTHLLTDPEIEIALVPLTEGEYQLTIDEAASYDSPTGYYGELAREEVQRMAALAFAARNPDNLAERVWDSGDELRAATDTPDVNFLWDQYMEMVSEISPSILGLTTEDFDELKKALQEMDWSVLSGRQWYAAERFLLSISPEPLLDSKPGSSSTKPVTKTNSEKKSMNTVSTN